MKFKFNTLVLLNLLIFLLVGLVNHSNGLSSNQILTISSDNNMKSYYLSRELSVLDVSGTGTIALMLSLDQDLSLTEIRNILHRSTLDLGEKRKDDFYGYG
ncbi:MAG: hypothetical protein ACW967_08065 [Candidatus Hodarchaeales archaeon]|jgi:hypothetical protein